MNIQKILIHVKKLIKKAIQDRSKTQLYKGGKNGATYKIVFAISTTILLFDNLKFRLSVNSRYLSAISVLIY